MRIHCTASQCRQWFTPAGEGEVRCPHCGRVYRRRLAPGQTRIQGDGYGLLIPLERVSAYRLRQVWAECFPGVAFPRQLRGTRVAIGRDWTHAQAREIRARMAAQGCDVRVISLGDVRRLRTPLLRIGQGR